MIKRLTSLMFLLSATCAWAVNSPINGLVQANCSIYTTTGRSIWESIALGNCPQLALTVGLDAIIRVDIAAADYYNTKVYTPKQL